MTRIDMFCAADDQHRVVLLVDLLQQAGQAVVLRPEPVPEPTDPCLVACTRRSLQEPWISALFGSDAAVVAVRLDNTPLPGPCARVINMQNWPARSADRKVGSLVGWLLLHGQRAGPVELAGAQPSTPGGAGNADHGRPRATPRTRSSDGLRALLVVGMLVLGGGLLWMFTPPPDANRDPDIAETDQTMVPPGEAGTADFDAGATRNASGAGADSSTAGAAAGTADGATGGAEGGTAAVAEGATGAVAEGATEAVAGGATEAVAGGATEAVPGGATEDVVEATAAAAAAADAPAPPARADALTHLCNARDLRAARAWAAALNWKQRRRLPDEPCVARLLQRPGFAELRDLLDLS